jgi:hypothetical protein
VRDICVVGGGEVQGCWVFVCEGEGQKRGLHGLGRETA